MKIDTGMMDKRVHVRLRTGGQYTGTVKQLSKGTVLLYLDNGRQVTIQSGMIASMEELEINDDVIEHNGRRA